MPSRLKTILGLAGVYLVLLGLHARLLSLPYFWDEAGYYIPAAWDFYSSGRLIPQSTLPTGHTPLVTVYLALAWRVFGFSAFITRAAIVLLAAATVFTLYSLGRRVVGREGAAWSALLLAMSPLFFSQSSLVHLDLAAALFTTLALWALVEKRAVWFTATASLAALSKETAVIVLPVAWVYAWRNGQALAAAASSRRPSWQGRWLALTFPLLPLAGWSLYYHHATGYWTGNREYLSYNFYATLVPARILWTLLRRLYETFVGGFNWILTLGALSGIWRGAKEHRAGPRQNWLPASGAGVVSRPAAILPDYPRAFLLLAASLLVVYLVMLSVVGGAVLPRYLLPIFPPLILLAVLLLWRLPVKLARLICGVTTICFIWAWFLNPPYPFPFEDNLAYGDFVRLHQQAAEYLEAQPGQPCILTAWPATDELERPLLGYVRSPLRVASIPGFTNQDFNSLPKENFDLLYLYSRKWEPRYNWIRRFHWLARVQERYFGYQPQAGEAMLMARYRLKLLKQFERRGQWVRIYGR
jgi:4-amino-4-deoxy-L-arabinose transferase-like glycosyltransferase